MLLYGCSGASNEGSETNEQAANSSTTAPEKSSQSSFPRTLTDEKGEVTIPDKPKKIALTAWGFIDLLLTLEPEQLATTGYNYYSKLAAFKPYFESDAFVDLGTDGEINLEKLLEYEPDIILAGGEENEKVYTELTKIAPVFFLDAAKGYDDWKWALTEYAKALGLEEEAQQVIANHDARLSDAKSKLQKYEDQDVVFLDPADKAFYFWGTERLNTYYNEIGLKMPDNELAESGGDLSLEGLIELNPDHIFLHNRPTAPLAPILEQLQKSAVWNQLDAVKNGHVYPLESSAFSPGPTGVAYGIEEILKNLK
ncbi:iron-siderophore ABC transporter substrate-binding protein [Paenibacillus sp. YIM B09110]|uniref:iron-siderophore ABC transporter substrate-binding protein n=1 Tax=Paenibacillus sp. YIM B09110 TaxID=3126102 RepID=UPI00301D400F